MRAAGVVEQQRLRAGCDEIASLVAQQQLVASSAASSLVMSTLALVAHRRTRSPLPGHTIFENLTGTASPPFPPSASARRRSSRR